MGGKNFLYNFAYAVFKDREKQWFFFRENAPACFCILECDTPKQPIFSCPSLQPLKNILQTDNWRVHFLSTSIVKLKYVVAVIRRAYAKSSTSWKIHFQTFLCVKRRMEDTK